MHSWFKYFDQNLKGFDGAESKLDLYSAFKIMADKGVLIPPFNNPPEPKKGLSQISGFTGSLDAPRFKQRVDDYIDEMKAKSSKKERSKSASSRRKVKTIVTNKKVIEE